MSEYTVCKICDTAYMCMITISLKYIGKDNKSPNIAICKNCLRQVIDNTKDLSIGKGEKC